MGWLVLLLSILVVLVSSGAMLLVRRANRVAANVQAQAAHNLLRLDQRESEIDELRVKLERAQLLLASCRGELGIST